MPITRNTKGTIASKTSATTLTLSTVTVSDTGRLVVGLTYEDSQGDPTSVTFGTKNMHFVNGSKQNNVTGNITTIVYSLGIHQVPETADIVATWSVAVAAKVMEAVHLSNAKVVDVESANADSATGAPNTGTAVTTKKENTISTAFFGSAGPSGDTAGTAGDGHALGQRDGTTGGAATSNVTLQETYESLTDKGDCRASMTGATSREWASSIVTFKAPNNVGTKPPIDEGAIAISFDTVAGTEELTIEEIRTFVTTFVDDVWDLPANQNKIDNGLPASAATNLSDTQKRDILKLAITQTWLFEDF